MFHWIRVDYTKHPGYATLARAEIEEAVFQTIVKHGTLLMKGSWFCPEGQREGDAMFFRATYAATPLGDIKEGVRRFGEALMDAFGLGDGESDRPAEGRVSG
jgi:aromatic amino acid aminotransferase I